MLTVNVYNPSFPKDKTKSRPLTKAQFDVVHDYIVGCMSSGRKIRESMIIQMLIVAGLPIDFESKQ